MYKKNPIFLNIIMSCRQRYKEKCEQLFNDCHCKKILFSLFCGSYCSNLILVLRLWQWSRAGAACSDIFCTTWSQRWLLMMAQAPETLWLQTKVHLRIFFPKTYCKGFFNTNYRNYNICYDDPLKSFI